jgi:hypothetical protein
MLQLLKKLDKYLTNLGSILANLAIHIIGIGLMLYPSVVIMSFVVSLIQYFAGSKPIMPLSAFWYLALTGIVSWYLGIGLYNATKEISNDHIEP